MKQVCLVCVDPLYAAFLNFPEVEKLTEAHCGCKKVWIPKICGEGVGTIGDTHISYLAKNTLKNLFTVILMSGQPYKNCLILIFIKTALTSFLY